MRKTLIINLQIRKLIINNYPAINNNSKLLPSENISKKKSIQGKRKKTRDRISFRAHSIYPPSQRTNDDRAPRENDRDRWSNVERGPRYGIDRARKRTETDVNGLLNAEQSTGNAHLRFSSPFGLYSSKGKSNQVPLPWTVTSRRKKRRKKRTKKILPEEEDHSWIHRSRKLSSIALKQSGDHRRKRFPRCFMARG